MAHVFRHPRLDRQETVNAGSVLGALFASVVYLAYKRLWLHAATAAIILALPVFLGCACLLSFTLPLVSLAYALAIQDILATDYLDRGWIELAPAGQ